METMAKKKSASPTWKILKKCSSKPVNWINHKYNPRFALYSPSNDFDPTDQTTPSDNLVLDKETGLVWPRDANLINECNWLDASTLAREFALGNRQGWRLPSVEELSSLVDLGQLDVTSPVLPEAHPFLNVQYGSGVNAYWSSTNNENPNASAWFVNFWRKRNTDTNVAGLLSKSSLCHVWPVRGGIAGINWNW